ncbi:MAG: efflux RND transporter permease subunit [Phycisphaerales bacterium]
MNLPKAAVARPVFTVMATLIVVVLGAVSLVRLRIDLLPEVERPTLSVSTDYEGASPEVMERLVTQVVEEILATVPGVEEMTSESSEGESSVRVRFGWGTDIDTMATEVRARLEDELNELPDEVDRPQIRKFDVNSFPVVLLGIGSELDPIELTTLVEEQVRYRFARIPGVAQIDPWGGYNREVRVELDPARLRALGLPLNEILDAIRGANLDLPAGRIERGQYEVTLRAPAEFANVEEIGAVVVAVRDGAPVRLDQIADVKDTYERLTRHIRVNGELGMRLAVRKQADANTVEVANAVLAEIERVNEDFPQITVVPVINQGNFIERSIRNVAFSVLYGGALAVLVLLFFLRNLRSTLVISLAIPISVVATFALMYGAGFTINLMTLGGLALGIGMMVDSSIVVLENIYRRKQEQGEAPRKAAVLGSVEVGPAILASTITTLVIFLPLIFVEGVSGVLFSELAYVIAFSLVCSLVIALSVVPMLASRLLQTNEQAARDDWRSRLKARSDRAFGAIDGGYKTALGWVLHHRVLVLLGAAVVFAASVASLPVLGREFLPPSDEGEVRVSGEMDVGTRLDLIDRQTRLMEDIVLDAVPEKVAWVTSVQTGDDDGSEGEIRMSLVPSTERERSNTEIADDLRERLEGAIPGMTIRTRAPQGQFLLERLLGGDDGLTVEVRGFELDVLAALTERVVEAMGTIDGLENVDTSLNAGQLQEELRIDRAKAADVGVSARDIAEAIETAVAGSQAGEFRPRGQSYRILVQLQDARSLSIEEILDLMVRSRTGEDIALRNLVTTEPGRGPSVIERKDQQRLFTVSADVAGRDTASVAADLEAALDEIPRPAGYEFTLAGNVEEQRRSQRELLISFGLALVLVYMVLASQYESLRDPLIVMLAVPLAAIGVVLMLLATNTTLNVQSYIGCIMLGGIVVNNAILLVDQAGHLRRDGMPTREAAMEAGRRRLRPILMTSMTTILGLTPLALGIGEGADAQAPLARAVIGGLVSSMLTTLVVVPAAYTLLHRDGSEREAANPYQPEVQA